MDPYTVAEIAGKIGAKLEGDGGALISGVAGLREAKEGDLSFLANPKYSDYVATTEATAVVVPSDWTGSSSAAILRVDHPDQVFGEVAGYFLLPQVEAEPGVHPTALVHETATVGERVSIGPYTVIEGGAGIGAGTVIGAGSYIGHGVQIGTDGLFRQHVSVREYCRIGDRVVIHNGTVIGSDGFGFALQEDGSREKIAQRGIVEIGDDVEIGANVTIDRARFGRTRIGNRVKIDNLVMVAHNVVVEDDAVLVAQVGISGSTVVRKSAILAGQVGVGGHLEIGEGAIVGAQGGVTKDVKANTYVSGYPAMPHMEAAKLQAHLKRLPQLKKRIAELEARIKELESDGSGSPAGERNDER